MALAGMLACGGRADTHQGDAGAADAMGGDEASWPVDVRVDDHRTDVTLPEGDAAPVDVSLPPADPDAGTDAKADAPRIDVSADARDVSGGSTDVRIADAEDDGRGDARPRFDAREWDGDVAPDAVIGCADNVECPNNLPYCNLMTGRCVAVTSLTILPSAASIPSGGRRTFTASATFSDLSVNPSVSPVTWGVVPGVGSASIDGTGVATGRSKGEVTITANFLGVPATAPATVTKGEVDYILTFFETVVSQSVPSVSVDAFAIYTDGAQENVTMVAKWSSDDAFIASYVPESLFLLTGRPGKTSIRVSFGGREAVVPFEVMASELVSIEIVPDRPTYETGVRSSVRAMGHYGDGAVRDLSDQAQWGSPGNVLSVNDSFIPGEGVEVQTFGPGMAEISAFAGNISTSTMATVTGPRLDAVIISPAGTNLREGESLQFAATGVFADGTTRDLTDVVDWFSSNPAVAPILPSMYRTTTTPGLATGLSAGVTDIGGTVLRSATVSIVLTVRR